MGSEQESPEGKEEHKSDVIVEPEKTHFVPHPAGHLGHISRLKLTARTRKLLRCCFINLLAGGG